MESNVISSTTPDWPLAKKIAFRFFFIYAILYMLPFPINAFDLTEGLDQWVADSWNIIAQWIAPWFGEDGPVQSAVTGSGDKISDYLTNFIQLCLAVIGTVTWSLADRKRMSYTTLWMILFILLRYYLAWNMLSYGSYKIFKLQFPSPSLYRLVQPYGDSSPMGLAWTFMGASDLYTWFAGWMEVLGGALLLFRRTATLGALVSLGVMLNVFMMNMSYDIPVKLFSFHLMIMAAIIALPDVRRLLNVLLLNRPTFPRPLSLSLKKKWQKITRWLLKSAFIGYACIWSGVEVAKMLNEYGESSPKPPHYGIYDVQQFVVNSDTIPPLLTDTTRWKRVIVAYPGVIRVYGMPDTKSNYRFEVDSIESSVSITSFADSSQVFQGTISQVDSTSFRWSGMLEEDTLEMDLTRFDEEQFRLLNRGFHWVNEYPFNR